MAGPSASVDGDGDAVMFDDGNDDFQLPDNFDNMVNMAADGVLSLRHVYYPNKKGKRRKISRKKPDPSVSTLRLILYHLPLNEQVPQKIISFNSVGDNLCVLFELKPSLKLNPRLRYHKSSC